MKTSEKSNMFERKRLKKQAKDSVKKHYLTFVLLCLLAAFIGTEFSGSLTDLKQIPNLIMFLDASGEDKAIEDNTTTGIGGSFSLLDEQKQNIIMDLIKGNRENAQNTVQESMDYAKDHESSALGRRRGVLSAVVNQITSGGFITSLVVMLDSFSGMKNLNVGIAVVFLLIVIIGYNFFLKNIFDVIMRRLFLEARRYDKVNYGRGFFLYRSRCWFRACIALFKVQVCQFLWSLTVIGGFIKAYSYRMTSFIIAENPTLTGKEVRKLSRKMMDGHKWECFKIDVTLLGWSLLGYITFGISNLLFANAYRVSIDSEYYDYLRSLMLEKDSETRAYFIDTYLFKKPTADLLTSVYEDIPLEDNAEAFDIPQKNWFTRFMANVFGVSFANAEEEKAYDEAKAREVQLSQKRLEKAGVIYPSRLYPLAQKKQRKLLVSNVNYMRRYSIWSIILMFFIISFIGWCWEVSLHLITDHSFVNRGVMHGPWLPIYGTGGIMMVLALYRCRKNVFKTFCLGILLSGIVEYSTAVLLEYLHDGQKWWDYTGYYLNIHGRCCAEGLLIFGLGGLAIIYVVAPVLDALIKKIPYKVVIAICLILLVVFTVDNRYSSKHPNTGKGISDYTEADASSQVDYQLDMGGIDF